MSLSAVQMSRRRSNRPWQVRHFRLRYGTYGQRQPGVQMQRIKIPLGMLSAEKMTALADLSEEYSDAISHITTRQDIQFHFVNILDCPNLFRRLAEVGITTREAC